MFRVVLLSISLLILVSFILLRGADKKRVALIIGNLDGTHPLPLG